MERLGRRKGEVDRIGFVVLLLFGEQGFGLSQVFQHKRIRIVERCAAHGFFLEVFRAEYYSQFIFGRRRVVGFAEAFQQFRVAERTDGVHFARVDVQFVEFLVVGFLGFHRVDAVQIEVAVADGRVERAVDRFDFGVGRAHGPQVVVAVDVAVALHRIYQVALDVRQQRQIARVEGRALQTGVDADHVLFGIVVVLHPAVFGYRLPRKLVQAGDRTHQQSERREADFDMVFYSFHYLVVRCLES